MNVLIALVVAVAVFRAVMWFGGAWITGAEVLDDDSD